MSKKCIVIFMMDEPGQTYNGKPLMLQEALFCPVLDWCMRAWTEKGIGRFFIVADPEYHDEIASCIPEGAVAAVGTQESYERDIAEFAKGCWVEEVHEAMLPVGSMMLSFHTVPELIRLQQAVKEDIAVYHAKTGVNVLDPDHTYIDPRVSIGAGTTILPGTILRGNTIIGPTPWWTTPWWAAALWSTPPRCTAAPWAGRSMWAPMPMSVPAAKWRTASRWGPLWRSRTPASARAPR